MKKVSFSPFKKKLTFVKDSWVNHVPFSGCVYLEVFDKLEFIKFLGNYNQNIYNSV